MRQSGESAEYREAFVAERSSVARASQWLREVCQNNGVPKGALDRLDICLNEVLANIVGHGGSDIKSHPLRLELVFRAFDSSVMADLTIWDAGVVFDPTVAQPRPRSASLDEAQPGGLGILMLQENADKLAYRRVNGLNRLSISVCWSIFHE